MSNISKIDSSNFSKNLFFSVTSILRFNQVAARLISDNGSYGYIGFWLRNSRKMYLFLLSVPPNAYILERIQMQQPVYRNIPSVSRSVVMT
jgi:hypothetical protein